MWERKEGEEKRRRGKESDRERQKHRQKDKQAVKTDSLQTKWEGLKKRRLFHKFLFVLQLKRFKTYSFLLQSKMAAFPELEPSLVEIAIGEVEEPTSPPEPSEAEVESKTAEPEMREGSPSKKDRARSMMDRYSYRAAIYKQDGS